MGDEFYTLIPKKYTTKLKLNRRHIPELVFRHGHIGITDYEIGDNWEFEKSLSVFDEINWKYRMVGGYYVKELHEFRVNRAYSPGLLAKFFPNYSARVENDAFPADRIDIELLVPPRDDFQRVGLTFMCCQEEYKKNARYTQQLIEAKVGSGKSWLGVAATCFMQCRTVIIVPFSKLTKQWRDYYLQYTNLTEEDIMIVQGSPKCQKILDGECKDIKVFIFLVDTLVAFQKQYGDMETIELLRATNAYTKIVDEVHRDIRGINMIEALSNFHMNFYLSASPGRAQSKENWIFRMCYHNIPKFGANFTLDEEKHINVIIRGYRFTPTMAQVKRMVHPRKKWLNSKSYETELINSPDSQNGHFKDAIRSMLLWGKKILKKGNKILLLCETIAGTEFLQGLAEEIFPGRTSRYYGGLKPNEKEEALKATVICATITSLGTGADIPGLQHVHNITTYSNWITAVQTSGRARKLKDGTPVFYIEYVNHSYRKTESQYEKRKPQLVKIAKSGKLMMMD